jgi:hypothetical protein
MFFKLPQHPIFAKLAVIYYLQVLRVSINFCRVGLVNNKPDRLFTNLLDGLTTMHPPIFYLGFCTLLYVILLKYNHQPKIQKMQLVVKTHHAPLVLTTLALLSGGY